MIALRKTLRNAENDRLMSEFEANGIESTDNGSFYVWIRARLVLSITVFFRCDKVQCGTNLEMFWGNLLPPSAQ